MIARALYIRLKVGNKGEDDEGTVSSPKSLEPRSMSCQSLGNVTLIGRIQSVQFSWFRFGELQDARTALTD